MRLTVMMSKIYQIVFMCFLGVKMVGFSLEDSPPPPVQVESDEEAFLIRRIAEFWKDGDYQIVKTQITEFFEKYPESALKDNFLGILGDIHLQENHFETALGVYQSIQDPKIQEKVIINKLHCYYELHHFDQLLVEGKPLLGTETEALEGREKELVFLLAEGCFRQSLKEVEAERKSELVHEARRYYLDLKETPYSEAAQFALAEICAKLGENENGAQAYLELATLHPDMEEDLLFQAATLQSHYDQRSAIDTFRRVKKLEGDKAGHAAFNLIALLFQNEEYEQVISFHEQMGGNIPESYQPLFHFIVGRSFFLAGDHKGAIAPLGLYIDSQEAPSDRLQDALLIQMTCAYQTDREDLFSSGFERFKTLFPNASHTSKALFMHAMLLKKLGFLSQADEKLIEIKREHTDFEDQESFLFEYGLLAHQNERWKEGYDAFKEYIESYPESSQIDMAWKLFLSSSFRCYKNGQEGDPHDARTLFQDLSDILQRSEYLNEEEIRDYSLLYAKIAYELKEYPETLRVLQEFVFNRLTEEEDSSILAEAHLIAGFCHVEMLKDYSAFCRHAEQAIKINPQVCDNGNIHLQLYNAYISLAGFGSQDQTKEMIDQKHDFISHAAKHLQLAIDRGGAEVQVENRLWLAGYYSEYVKQYMEERWTHTLSDRSDISDAVDKAVKHYMHLLYSDGDLIEISLENLYLEHAALKLAKLIDYKGGKEEKLKLIEGLIDQQSRHAEFGWETKEQALFELASVYRDLGLSEKAYETFHFMKGFSDSIPNGMLSVAILESARLHFNLLDETCKRETNEEVLEILNDLKELQIRKSVHSEPVHLEAALDYARIRLEVSEIENKESRHLFLLGRIRDEFTSEKDIMNQGYLWELRHDLKKKQIFDVYMQFIDAEEHRLLAAQMQKQERVSEMQEQTELAMSLYHMVKESPATPRSLYERVSNRIKEITTVKTSLDEKDL